MPDPHLASKRIYLFDPLLSLPCTAVVVAASRFDQMTTGLQIFKCVEASFKGLELFVGTKKVRC